MKIETFITSKQLVSDLVQPKEMSQEVIKQDVKVEETDRKLTKEQMEKTVESLNGFVSPTQTSLRFTLHEKLNEYYVQVVDTNTKEVVREIPSKKMMDFYASMKENIGIFIDKKI